MKTLFLRWFFKLTNKSPAEMPAVSYWKTKASVAAKVTHNQDGALIMKMEGERYEFPGFPRGYILFGKLSKLKHEIKNQAFNDSWWKLERGVAEAEVIADVRGRVMDNIFALAEESKYDMVPPERMIKAVREVHRAWTKVAPGERSSKIRDILTFVLQEDDGYRFRFQWLATYFNPNRWWMRLLGKDPIEQFEKALGMLEHGEVIGDMKEKARLLKRILLLVLKDQRIRALFLAFCREMNWNKIKLSEADKFHFRGKYFKVDYDLFDY